MKRQHTIQTELYCSECSTMMPIARKAGKKKSKGHLKHMYCPKCKYVTGFQEGVTTDKNINFWETFHEVTVDKSDKIC